MESKQPIYDLFISYSVKDQEWAERFAARLEQGWINDHAIRVFMMSRDSRIKGENFESALERALRSSRALAVVITPNSARSEWVKKELAIMANLDRPIFPVYRRTSDIPEGLQSRFYIDFRNDDVFDKNIKKLISLLGEPSEEDVEIAEALDDQEEIFVLWAVYVRFCTRIEDFRHHFGAEFPIESLIKRLELKNLCLMDDEEIVLTQSGSRAASSLGEPDTTAFANRARLSEEVQARFQPPSHELNEQDFVEQTFIQQLVQMRLKGQACWQHIQGDKWDPKVTERENFRETLLKQRLRAAIRRINRNDHGREWLDDMRIDRAILALERVGAGKQLMEANREGTELLLAGVKVSGDPVQHKGNDVTLSYIDFEHPEQNDFLVINQFRVNEPGGLKFSVPDIVLFVNGIPLVVIECKSPASTNPMEEGITQLLRYSNQRDLDEGVENLFYFNQFLVSTYYYQARVGTIGASYEHYLEWKDTAPTPMTQVIQELGAEKLTSQQMLVAGMLRPEHLLDLARSFTVFQQNEGKQIKIIARYHQFRAVHYAIDRLLHGKTRAQHGDTDQRGGIVWHTQGSGKSLTMVFLVRKMRRNPDLRKFKVVVITDRKDLQKQLAETASLTNETVNEVNRVSELAPTLSRQGPELVFATIQKYQDPDADQPKEEETPQFPRLNESESILLIVDEAHRSHTNTLHLNLMDALPNAAKIGFTGTPIMRDTRKRTTKIFGEFIDTYSIKQSEEDEATVSILYEGRTARAVVSDGRTLDQLFEDMFVERTTEELEAIKQKYATTGSVLEAKELIAAKAKNILRHYVDTILPNGFKAQVVATSRAAAVRYQEALENARGQLVAQLDEFVPEKDYDAFSGNGHSAEHTFLARAYKYRETIRHLEFATVISGSTNQDPKWDRWTERPKIDANIARFKKPLFHSAPEKRDNLAFLCVKSMLITGFDAPIEQALYLDRKMEGHELLQTIARVNRTHTNKSAGYVVDYVGVVNHLKEALAAYNVPDVHGAMINLKDELPKLADRHARVLAIFKERGISEIHDIDTCVDLLRDKEIRADFVVKLRKFLDSLEIVMPRTEARPYLSDAKTLGFINKSAENLYRDIELNMRGAGEKVRRLIDQYIVSKGIDPTIPAISILDSEFVKKVDNHKSDQAKASEMEHAARYEINERYQEDPVYYKKLSERLDEILRQFQENWEELVRALRPFVDDLRRGRPQDETGLDPRTQAPFLSVLVEEVGEEAAKPHLRKLASYTVDLVDHVRREIALLDFWRDVHSQERLLSWIVRFLDSQIDLSSLNVEFDRLPAIASRLLDLARANRSRLNP